MRIALDFDGTIADAAGAKVRYAQERWGVELTAALSMRPGALPLLGEERYEEMIRDVFGTAMSVEMEPMPGAVDAMTRLGAIHDLHIVTARFDHEGEFATQWLQRHGLKVRSMNVTNRGAKVDHCVGLGAEILLEDSPGELARFADHDHRVAMALLDTPYNANDERPESWHLVPDWVAFEALVERLTG
jgi:uncharacterized HAD superfamily protein